jgi:hypothetical protein
MIKGKHSPKTMSLDPTPDPNLNPTLDSTNEIGGETGPGSVVAGLLDEVAHNPKKLRELLATAEKLPTEETDKFKRGVLDLTFTNLAILPELFLPADILAKFEGAIEQRSTESREEQEARDADPAVVSERKRQTAQKLEKKEMAGYRRI